MKIVDRFDVVVAIVDIYDQYVIEHGFDVNVFSIATRMQVAKYLDTSPYCVSSAIKDETKHGYAEFKNKILARHGRGRIGYFGNIPFFDPFPPEDWP